MSSTQTSEFSRRVAELAQQMPEDWLPVLAALFDLTGQRLVRFATAVTRNQHDAEDAVQSALVRIARERVLFTSARDPWAYLLSIVRNESRQILRRKLRWSIVSSLSDLLIHRRVDELEQEEQHLAVWRALRRLPVDQAEIVVLKIWEELTFAQIAQVLEQSPNTVASRYRSAMRRLQRSLAPLHRETLI